jgi:hypothetical protein
MPHITHHMQFPTHPWTPTAIMHSVQGAAPRSPPPLPAAVFSFLQSSAGKKYLLSAALRPSSLLLLHP